MSPDVEQLIADRLASGHYASEVDVLRDASNVLKEVDDDAAAAQAAINEWKNGDDGLSLDEVFESIRLENRRKLPE